MASSPVAAAGNHRKPASADGPRLTSRSGMKPRKSSMPTFNHGSVMASWRPPAMVDFPTLDGPLMMTTRPATLSPCLAPARHDSCADGAHRCAAWNLLIDASPIMTRRRPRDAHGDQGPHAPGDRHRLVAASTLVRRRPVGPAARHGAARRQVPRAVPRRALDGDRRPGAGRPRHRHQRRLPPRRGLRRPLVAPLPAAALDAASSTRSCSTSGLATDCWSSRPAR